VVSGFLLDPCKSFDGPGVGIGAHGGYLLRDGESEGEVEVLGDDGMDLIDIDSHVSFLQRYAFC